MKCKALASDILLAMGSKELGVEVQEVYYTGGKEWPWILEFVWKDKPISQNSEDLNVEL